MKLKDGMVDTLLFSGLNIVYFALISLFCYYTIGYLYNIDKWFSFPLAVIIIMVFTQPREWIKKIG